MMSMAFFWVEVASRVRDGDQLHSASSQYDARLAVSTAVGATLLTRIFLEHSFAAAIWVSPATPHEKKSRTLNLLVPHSGSARSEMVNLALELQQQCCFTNSMNSTDRHDGF